VDDRHLSDVEALMWTLEADPHLSSTFANVTLFDRPVDMDRLLARMERAVAVVPRLRRRVEGGLAGLTPPRWVQERELDLDRHVRRTALEGPGEVRDLLDLAVELAGRPFERDRPLWEFVVVDGLADGRGAMVQKMHHTITDGEGGVRMSAQFIDLERDPPEPPPLPPATDEPDEPDAGVIRGVADSIAAAARTPLDLARQAVDGAVGLIGEPDRLATMPVEAAEAARSLARQVGVTGSALSPLWRERTLDRRLDLYRVPLAGAKAAAAALGAASTTCSWPARPAGRAPTTARSASRSRSCAWRCRSAPAPRDPRPATRSPRLDCWSRSTRTPAGASRRSTDGWRSPSRSGPSA